MPTFTTRDPATGEPLATYDALTPEALDRALDASAEAFRAHRQRPLADRAALLQRAAELLARDRERHAALMTREMGKPLAQARAEVDKCAWLCRFYARCGPGWLADERAETGAHWSGVAFEPLGPLLAVMPWNFPYWQAIRAAAPALLAGNAVLLKHAENVLGCGEALEGLWREAGAGGAFRHLVVEVDRVEAVIRDGRIAAVTLTGSERAGRAVGRAAGEALKPCVLELGGSDAFIVLDDADLDLAVRKGVASRTQNNGQSCIAAKRFILHRRVAKPFTRRFVDAMEALVVGPPEAEGTDLGPLAREDLRGALHRQVETTQREGARLLCGGRVPDSAGWYYPPTVLAGVTEAMLPFREELFGPVAALTVAHDEDDAVRLANTTRFGLGGAVFTRDRDRGERVARRLHTGAAFVNEMTQSHPALPFGGVGASGVGRELARQGLRAFVNEKALWVG